MNITIIKYLLYKSAIFAELQALKRAARDLIWDYMAHFSLGEPRAMFSMTHRQYIQ
jgi:hypothetical protein